ncbi:uncharacterized protein [Watersipora subatra]|uniref:uncharacterized protein n=1 Tax=Watersipora subatra TaxID=2589382 RepID=UPI00355C99FC
MKSLKDLNFRLMRQFECDKCSILWSCSMDIHPTGHTDLENITVRQMLESALLASKSELFKAIDGGDLEHAKDIMSRKVRDCPENVEIKCRSIAMFSCPACSSPRAELIDSIRSNLSSAKTETSSYTLTFETLYSGAAKLQEQPATCRSLPPTPPGSRSHQHPSIALRPLPLPPSSSAARSQKVKEQLSLESSKQSRDTNFTNNVFSCTTTKKSICKVLEQKAKGWYAVVELALADGGNDYHRTPFLILCLQLKNGFKVVFEDPQGMLFIHQETKFTSMKALLNYYKTNPTKCGANFAHQLTRHDLVTLSLPQHPLCASKTTDTLGC